MGGVIYVDGNQETEAELTSLNSIYLNNIAYLGGAIGFSFHLKVLNANIMNNTFLQNYGSSKLNIQSI